MNRFESKKLDRSVICQSIIHITYPANALYIKNFHIEVRSKAKTLAAAMILVTSPCWWHGDAVTNLDVVNGTLNRTKHSGVILKSIPCDISVNEVTQEEKSYIHLGRFAFRVPRTISYSSVTFKFGLFWAYDKPKKYLQMNSKQMIENWLI